MVCQVFSRMTLNFVRTTACTCRLFKTALQCVFPQAKIQQQRKMLVIQQQIVIQKKYSFNVIKKLFENSQ